MARGLNSAAIIGNVGKDPEVRHTQSGTVVANFSIATSETWYDKAKGEKQEKTEWHRVVAWGKLAEVVERYVKKGRQIYIQGRIETRTWEDSGGNKKYTTEIVAKEILLLGPRQENADLAEQIFDRSDYDPQSIDPLVDEEDIPF